MFLKSTRSVLINIQPSVTSYKYMVTVQRAIQTVFSNVCLSICVFLCSDDNDTKCSKLLKASPVERLVVICCVDRWTYDPPVGRTTRVCDENSNTTGSSAARNLP